jgi:hypothetical protein
MKKDYFYAAALRYVRLLTQAATLLMALNLVFASAQAQAGELVHIDSRKLKVSAYWHSTSNASKTLFVFPGGGGGFGKIKDGLPTSGNFLVRTTALWIRQGYNIFIFGQPDDSNDLDYGDRIGHAHLQDVRAAMNWVKAKNAQPIWLIGTSRGSISAAHAAIQLQDPLIEGLVLTSSIVNYKKSGAIPKQDIGSLAMPVLLYHSEADACVHCQPQELPRVFAKLNGSNKLLMMAKAGEGASGDPCRGQHHHGFIGVEEKAVQDIAAFVNLGSQHARLT